MLLHINCWILATCWNFTLQLLLLKDVPKPHCKWNQHNSDGSGLKLSTKTNAFSMLHPCNQQIWNWRWEQFYELIYHKLVNRPAIVLADLLPMMPEENEVPLVVKSNCTSSSEFRILREDWCKHSANQIFQLEIQSWHYINLVWHIWVH